jgi:A/G-specific adenine glycosylase
LAAKKNNIFQDKLRAWYKKNQRDLPWRNSNDPYVIWLSEIILQQTRVAQGLPYFNKFLEVFPNVNAFAIANEDEILRLWQGLGYYSRARNMHATAKYINTELNGIFPTNYQGLLKLKGVGSYTAAAIASFAYNESVAVLDGNVYRVLSRIFGVYTDITSPDGKKVFSKLANELLPAFDSAIHNQAIMEFGALQCTPSPNCDNCPLNLKCYAFTNKEQSNLPVKLKKLKITNRFFYYFIFEFGGKIFMKKRTGKGIWEGLFELYLIEKEEQTRLEVIFEEPSMKSYLQNASNIEISKEFKHQLTHQRLLVRFIWVKLSEKNKLFFQEHQADFYPISEVDGFPKPIIIANYFKNKNL